MEIATSAISIGIIVFVDYPHSHQNENAGAILYCKKNKNNLQNRENMLTFAI